mmetsp:Transcript_47517/g.64688  ORF Transcript_47517/g.64688 Transcript_47517/m.64688 type:complete len:275 (-) Transcript_47517:117-941(-)
MNTTANNKSGVNPMKTTKGGFLQADRINHASSASFFGHSFHCKDQPGPGHYNGGTLTKSTVLHESASSVRTSSFSRRARRSFASMQGAHFQASWDGADKILIDEGPDPGAYRIPNSCFHEAQTKRGFLTAAYASQSSRFVPTKKSCPGHEERLADRKLPPKLSSQITYPKLRPKTVDMSVTFADETNVATSMFERREEEESPECDHDDGEEVADKFERDKDTFVAPDPSHNRVKSWGRTARERTKMKEELAVQKSEVVALEGFKPPSSRAIRFY